MDCFDFLWPTSLSSTDFGKSQACKLTILVTDSPQFPHSLALKCLGMDLSKSLIPQIKILRNLSRKSHQIPVSILIAPSQEGITSQFQPTCFLGQERWHLLHCSSISVLLVEALKRSDYSLYLFTLAGGHLGFHFQSQGDACLVLAGSTPQRAKSSRWKSFLVRNIQPGHPRKTTPLTTSKGKF